MSEYEASPLARSDIRNLTNFIRQVCDLSNERYFPIVQFLELVMPQIDEQFFWVPASKSEMGAKHGLAYPEDKLIKIREDIYEGAVAGNGRDRFTIAHEIGHYFLHKKERVSFARSLGAAEKLPAFKDPEWQASAFAGELLAPPHIIRDLSVFEVMKYCGISQDAAQKQLKSINK